MPEVTKNDQLKLIGEVIEMYERDGVNFAKIKYDGGIIDISTGKLKDFHLGDRVTVNTLMNIESLNNEIEDPIK